MPKPTQEQMSKIGKSNVNRSKTHERLIANELTNWSNVQFRRRRAEGRGSAVVEIEGAADVIAVGWDFHFSVEAKCGKGFSFDAMFKNLSTTIFSSWWHQATYDANIMTESRGRKIYPLLFFRPFLNANWIAFPVSAANLFKPKSSNVTCDKLWFSHLIFDGYSKFGAIAHNVSHSHKNKNIISLQLDDLIFCRWYDFSMAVDPKSAFYTYPSLV